MAGLIALWACAGLAGFGAQPASAQFGTIFGDNPPRPPADVPGAPPSDPRLPPQGQQPPQSLPPSSNLPPSGGRGVSVQTQPLPPPPGAPAAPLDTRPQQSALPPQQQQQPQSPTPGLPPGQRQPRGTPQQPGDAASVAPPAPPSDDTSAEPPTPKIENKTAVFSGLDKITGRIISFDVALNETVQFGALQVTPRACYTRPPTELPKTDGFVDVSEVTLQGEVRRIFTGWMFAASPGLHAVEHPIYDVWLTDCKDPATKVAEEPAPSPAPAPAAAPKPTRPAAPRAPSAAPAQRPAAARPPSGTLFQQR